MFGVKKLLNHAPSTGNEPCHLGRCLPYVCSREITASEERESHYADVGETSSSGPFISCRPHFVVVQVVEDSTAIWLLRAF